MENEFDPNTQELVFKPIYLQTMDIITVYQGDCNPSFIIDPLTTTQEEMQQYWSYGLHQLFDIIDKI